MKGKLKKVLIILLSIIAVLVLGLIIVFRNEIHSLASIQKVDDYGMFQMTYYGDYGFDEFLKAGATSDEEIADFVAKRLLKGVPIDLNLTGAGCTAFVTKNEAGEVLYGRNFDFEYAPSLQVVTRPKNGYASISTVNLSFAGYSQQNLPSGLDFNSFLTLAAPFLPFDGMNEKGVAIALLAVPEASLTPDENKVTLNTTTAIRLVLDKAATVEEAVELLRQYNIYFSGGIDCHFLIADASGASVLVEYYDGELQAVKAQEDYQIASNFIAYNGVNIGEGADEFERYDAVQSDLESHNEMLSEEQAAILLADIGVSNKLTNADKLQWSVVYNLSSLEGTLFAHRHMDNLIEFKLEPK